MMMDQQPSAIPSTFHLALSLQIIDVLRHSTLLIHPLPLCLQKVSADWNAFPSSMLALALLFPFKELTVCQGTKTCKELRSWIKEVSKT